MKRIFFFFFPIFLIVVSLGLYFVDKAQFLCPVRYGRDIIIRNDNRGDGSFAANRSGRRVHEGLDLSAQLGEPVLACRFGIVIAARSSRGMGKFVIIRHTGNITTVYGHLSEILVRPNQLVRQGQIIARVGKTGNANHLDILSHLHFEVRKNGIPQDPLDYLE